MKTLFRLDPLCILGSIAFLSLILLPFASYGQNPRGALRGTVEDSAGGRVAGSRIVVKAAESSLQREAISDDRGEFRIDDLVSGSYRVVATAKGFAEASSDVKVLISSVQEITVTLKPQSVQQTVSVQAQASSITTEPIDTASAEAGARPVVVVLAPKAEDVRAALQTQFASLEPRFAVQPAPLGTADAVRAAAEARKARSRRALIERFEERAMLSV